MKLSTVTEGKEEESKNEQEKAKDTGKTDNQRGGHGAKSKTL